MSKPKRPTEPAEVRIFKALNSSTWQYRTAEGIAKETHISTKDVEKALQTHPEKVRVSLVRRRDGQVLFASREKVSAIQDAWTAIRALSKAKFEK
jgi:hypothetical protein